MPKVAGVDVPNWCVAGAAVLTPAAIYAYLLRMSRQRQAFFADTPQPKETSAIFAGMENDGEDKYPGQSPARGPPTLQGAWAHLGVRLPKWLFPNHEFLLANLRSNHHCRDSVQEGHIPLAAR